MRALEMFAGALLMGGGYLLLAALFAAPLLAGIYLNAEPLSMVAGAATGGLMGLGWAAHAQTSTEVPAFQIVLGVLFLGGLSLMGAGIDFIDIPGLAAGQILGAAVPVGIATFATGMMLIPSQK